MNLKMMLFYSFLSTNNSFPFYISAFCDLLHLQLHNSDQKIQYPNRLRTGTPKQLAALLLSPENKSDRPVHCHFFYFIEILLQSFHRIPTIQ